MMLHKKIHYVALTLLASSLWITSSQAATVAFGQSSFTEPSGGGFSGSLYTEIFDAGGGIFSRTGENIAATGGDFTAVFQLVLDPSDNTETAFISNLKFNAFMLGTGDTGTPAGSLLPNSTGGGTLSGASSPTYNISGTTTEFNFGALAEGTTSDSFFFTHSFLDLSANGTSHFAVGDALLFAVTTTQLSAVNSELHITVIPLPATLPLLLSGILGLVGLVRQRRKA